VFGGALKQELSMWYDVFSEVIALFPRIGGGNA
jgi:hypothetical protein